ncbi:MAG: hypothetical protein JNL74_22225, partial [Fibrobacteres bacterium]|nr:hypothetical protein [Fibrobacterota bacterium]
MSARMNRFGLAVLLLTSMAISVPIFTAGPSYVVDTAGIKLSFTVSESTDVDVAVVDVATGKVIRHLAGGTIGGSSNPSAPLVAGLSQNIIWNGADDKGVWAANKEVSFKVRLGVRPKLHKTLRFEVPTTRYFNLVSIPRTPLYDCQTDTFISLSAYKFHDNYKDSSLYPTCAGTDMSVNDETDEILLRLSSRDGSSIPLVKYKGLTADTGKIQQFNVSGANSLSDTTAAGATTPYLPRMYYGEQFYGRDGKYIYHDEMFRYKLLYRYNAADGTPAPFVSTGVNYIKSRGFMGSGQIEVPFKGRGGCEGPDGSIYYGTFADTSNQQWWGSSSGTKQIGYVLRKWDPQGNLIEKDLIRTFTDIGMGVNVDMQGNIYVGLLIKPKGDTVPPEIRQQLTGARAALFPFAQGWYGSIVKFKPTGGTVYHNNATGTFMMTPGVNMAMTGQEWVYYGASCQNSFMGGYFGSRTSCICFTPRFDVDRYGRVIFPNIMQNEYICLDGNKNVMFKIHNRDFLKDSVKVGT